jgi:hypothetical protein
LKNTQDKLVEEVEEVEEEKVVCKLGRIRAEDM